MAYLPSPLDKPAIIGHKPDDKTKKISRSSAIRKASLVALAFKITADAHGDLYFLRLYQGTLKTGQPRPEPQPRQAGEHHADLRDARQRAEDPGSGPRRGHRGRGGPERYADGRYPVRSEEAGGAAEHHVPADGDHHVHRAEVGGGQGQAGRCPGGPAAGGPDVLLQDRQETGQTVISGMGELHLEILQHKLVKDMKVDVRVGKPRVAYKETITQTGPGGGQVRPPDGRARPVRPRGPGGRAAG